MFDSNRTTFPLAGEYKSMGSRTYKFIGPDDKMYNAYFTPTKGFIEVLFDCKESPGFDRLIADGYMTEKVNTVADLMLQYEAKYGNQMKAFWYQATRQRFLFYKKYFEQNSDKLKTFKYYSDKWFEDQKYGYAVISKDPDFDFDEAIVRFLM